MLRVSLDSRDQIFPKKKDEKIPCNSKLATRYLLNLVARVQTYAEHFIQAIRRRIPLWIDDMDLQSSDSTKLLIYKISSITTTQFFWRIC